MLSARINGNVLLSADDIKSLSVRSDAGGIPLGRVISESFSLTAVKRPGFTPEQLDGARVELFYGGAPCGVFFAAEVSAEEGSAFITLTGADGCGTAFARGFEDSPSAYPRTVKALCMTVISACPQMALCGDFPRSGAVIRSMPEWQSGITLNRVLSHIAFLAGGFARCDGEGNLEIVPLASSERHAADNCDLTLAGGAAFEFNCLRYPSENGYVRYAVRDISDNASNTLVASENPLVNAAALSDLKTELSGIRYEGGSVKIYGFADFRAGDVMETGGHSLLVTGRALHADAGGIKSAFTSRIPGRNAVNPRLSGGVTAFNPDGTICIDAIGGLDNRILGAERAYIGSLTADEIKTNGLSAKVVEAIELSARQISADSAETDRITAMAAEIIKATVRKLSAGSISADALLAASAELMAAKVGSLTADSVATDRLAAALAAFTVITAGTAEFDKATARHLIANALNVQDAAGGRVFISNLSVDYASIISANLGSLCVKASDGNFYRLEVTENGGVSAVRQEVSEAEIASGVTGTGRTIIESSINAGDLSATDIKGVHALINRLDAARIDVGALTAQSAFVNWLRTANIASNAGISAVLGRFDEVSGEVSEIRRCMEFTDAGLKQSVPGSIYYTVTDNDGFEVKSTKQVESVASMNAEEGIKAERLTVGQISVRRTGSGGWIWQRPK